MRAHLILFAHEFQWTPDQVWKLKYYEYVAFASHLDDLAEKRRQQRNSSSRRGRRR